MARIPISAKLLDVIQGVAQHGPHRGEDVIIKRFAGALSMGGKSGYRRTSVEWVELAVGQRHHPYVWQYSGKNLPDARKQIDDARRLISITREASYE